MAAPKVDLMDAMKVATSDDHWAVHSVDLTAEWRAERSVVQLAAHSDKYWVEKKAVLTEHLRAVHSVEQRAEQMVRWKADSKAA